MIPGCYYCHKICLYYTETILCKLDTLKTHKSVASKYHNHLLCVDTNIKMNLVIEKWWYFSYIHVKNIITTMKKNLHFIHIQQSTMSEKHVQDSVVALTVMTA